MNKRHTLNSNLTLINDTEWNGLGLVPRHSPYIEQYLERTLETMKRAVERYRRTTAIRFDLHIPKQAAAPDSEVISRFFSSLQAKINAHQLRKARCGQRVHTCQLRYVWVRERHLSDHRHYHCCILLNGDVYRHLGSFVSVNEGGASNMAKRVRSAWASALGCSWEDSAGLVHYVENGVYRVDANSPSLWRDYSALFYRLSYFAKSKTKPFGDDKNNFGCSRR